MSNTTEEKNMMSPVSKGGIHSKHKLKLPRIKKSDKPTLWYVITIIMLACIIYLGFDLVGAGARALRNSYDSAFLAERDASYQALYQRFYEEAEATYHVANRVSVSIGDLKEISALEVLAVSDVEYIVEEKDGNNNGITSWIEVPGQGMYTVNLQASEFIVDSNHSYVLVRIPNPELTNISIDYANVKKLFFRNDLLNDSYSVGEDLARKQLSAADLLIKKEFASNQYFYLNAQKAAVSTVQCLVRQLNPEVPDLAVDVEFY